MWSFVSEIQDAAGVFDTIPGTAKTEQEASELFVNYAALLRSGIKSLRLTVTKQDGD